MLHFTKSFSYICSITHCRLIFFWMYFYTSETWFPLYNILPWILQQIMTKILLNIHKRQEFFFRNNFAFKKVSFLVIFVLPKYPKGARRPVWMSVHSRGTRALDTALAGLNTSLNAAALRAPPVLPTARLCSGTAWSPVSEWGDLRDEPPLSLADPTTQGWIITSSVVMRSEGSLRSRHFIKHFAREDNESGKENWPRRILAKSPLCSAPWKGYLPTSIV